MDNFPRIASRACKSTGFPFHSRCVAIVPQIPAMPSPRPLAALFFSVLVLAGAARAAEQRTHHVVLVTIDGLRWQEVFTGAEAALMDKTGGVPDNMLAATQTDFWDGSAEARRRKLMPFVWETIARQGQLYGNRALGSAVSVKNAERISYPGYNEILTGRADPVITTNTPIPNPNVTVLEWLHGRPGFGGRVAACAEWRVFTAIINAPRSRLPVWVTRQHSPPSQATPRLLEIEQWMEDIPTFTPDEHFDAFVYHAAVDRFDTLKPRVFLLAFGEPDSWAHQKRYDRYLYSIQRCDRFVRQLWEKLQADPEYRGRTSLILTPDHGRGVLVDDWTGHGKKVPRCEETWLMALGPDTPALGERRNVPEVHQAQVAATVAALLGEDFGRAFPQAAPPVAEIVGRAGR